VRCALCEVNVGSVSLFPPSSIAPLVEAVKSNCVKAPREAEPVSHAPAESAQMRDLEAAGREYPLLADRRQT
jgi:hypothetical protein